MKESHPFFDQILQLRVDAPTRDDAEDMIRDAVAVGRALEQRLSADVEGNELATWNATAGSPPRRVSMDLYRLLALSQLMARSTGGAFDVTVGPLVRRRGEKAGRGDVAATLLLVGSERIVLEPPDKAGLEREGMSVHFGAVLRGYVLERMAARLRADGARRALLEFPDSVVVAIGPPPTEEPFRVRVARGPSLAGWVELRDRALSTARARRRGDDSVVSWIVDPRSGRFVEGDRQATAMALDAAIAEAWSTALVVDPDGALGLLEEPRDVEALVFDEHGEHTSGRFAAFASWKPARDGAGR